MTKFQTLAAATALSTLLSGCGSSEPTAEVGNWSFTRTPSGGYELRADAKLLNGAGGWFTPTITTTDERACATDASLDAIHPVNSPDPARVETTFQHHLPTTHKVSHVRLVVVYRSVNADPANLGDETVVFRDEKTLDPAGPGAAIERCPPSAEEKAESEQRRRDDDKAVLARLPTEREEKVATAINLSGQLCGRVLETYMDRSGNIVARCSQTRSGKGRVTYRIDADAGTVRHIR